MERRTPPPLRGAGAITYEVLKRRKERRRAKRLEKAAEEARGGLIAIEAAR